MAIIRYTASADNTVTNAFTETLQSSQRGTGSNMGKADVLEVFSIYGQSSSSVGPSSEASRILIKFDTTKLSSDRVATTIPASGSVNFYLCLYNTPHGTTLPEDYKLTVARVTNDWEEGYGLDMDNYKDKTYDGVGSNWVNGNGTFVSASATLKLAGGTNLASMHGQTFSLTDSDGTSQTFTIDYNSSTVTGGTIGFGAPGTDQNDNAMTAIKSAINNISALDIVASTITAVGDATSEHTLLIKQNTTGYAGNTSIDVSGVTGLTIDGSTSGFTGGSGAWATVGGDFVTADNSGMDFVDVSFPDGDEDIKVDITSIVEGWITTGNSNYGLMLKLTSSQEAYFSSATSATGSQNTSGAKRSYYTKKFFARDTEYYFKRPTIEARWNDSVKDDRGNIYLSSSLAPQADNLNTIYLYNYIRGSLADIKGSDSELPNVKFYYSSGSVPEGIPRTFIESNASKTSNNATRVSKGLYSISFAINENQFPEGYPYLVDVWSHEATEIHTGSAMLPKSFGFSNTNPNSQYVLAISNMRKHYNSDETARFRVSIRSKDWSPTVHTIASNNVELAIVPSASYEIFRVIDEEIVIPYGTGSTAHTMLSHDVSGNYFDLDMGNLEPGYSYGLRVSIYEDSIGSYREQPYTFKFRVRKDEY